MEYRNIQNSSRLEVDIEDITFHNSADGVLQLSSGSVNTNTTTTDLPEGTNQYHTQARARSALSAGSGVSYDNTTGIITNAGVTSVTGTANQIVANASTGDITLSLGITGATGINFNSSTGEISVSLVHPNRGGTGLTTFTKGDLICANTTTDGNGMTTFAKVTALEGDVVLISTGAGTNPVWSTYPTLDGLTLNYLDPSALVATTAYRTLTSDTSTLAPSFTGLNLTGLTASKPVFTDVSKNLTTTGTVPVNQGGTGQTTYSRGDMLVGNASNTLEVLTLGSDGRVLSTNGGFPVWSDYPVLRGVELTSLEEEKLVCCSGGVAGKLLISADVESPLSFSVVYPTGTLSLDTVQASKGGTGNSTYAIGDMIYASASATLSKLAISPTGSVLISGTNPAWSTSPTVTGLTTTGNIACNGELTMGTAPLACGATTGFFYGNSCYGSPTGVVSNPTGTVAHVYDATNNVPYSYNSGWVCGNGRVLISKQVLGSATGAFDFSSISQVFNHLELFYMGRGDSAFTNVGVRVQLNGDTASSYVFQIAQVGNTTIVGGYNAATSHIYVGEIAGGNALSGYAGSGVVHFPCYTQTTFYKTTISNTGEVQETGAKSYSHTTKGTWIKSPIEAITSIKLYPSSGNWATGSRAYLYGII